MPVDDRQDIKQQATIPDNLDQSPKFGSITELVKDAFVYEIKAFLNTKYDKLRAGELPRVDKYAVAVDIATDPLETAVNLIRSYPDMTEDLPLIAITSTTGNNNKLGLSDKYVAMVIPQAIVVGSVPAPYVLTDGMSIELTTQPDGTAMPVASRFILKSFLFTNIAAATASEVAEAINIQALYLRAHVISDGVNEYIELRAGGPNGKEFPNKIMITGGTALAALGFTVNQTDQNYGAGKRAYARHHMTAELTVAIEVMAESENVRTDVTDLLYDFLAYVMADRKFQFYGRSFFDKNVPDEYYQIILLDSKLSISGEQEIARAGDQKDKIYVNRINMPVTAIQYSDRTMTDEDGTPTTPLISVTLISTNDFPEPN